MTVRRPPKSRPLDEDALDELALSYVGRFATTRAKLRNYLARKLRERGWSGAREADPAAVADRMAKSGFIDDAGFAQSRARSLTARGYGPRRVLEALRGAGIEEEGTLAARAHCDREAVAAALRFAERRRIGPFAASSPDKVLREKHLAAMIRAGHRFDLARAIVDIAPGSSVDSGELDEFVSETGL